MAELRMITVGRDKLSWTVPLKANLFDTDAIEAAVVKAVRAKKALLSRGIDAQMYGPDGGFITAGFRTVGRFEIAEATDGA